MFMSSCSPGEMETPLGFVSYLVGGELPFKPHLRNRQHAHLHSREEKKTDMQILTVTLQLSAAILDRDNAELQSFGTVGTCGETATKERIHLGWERKRRKRVRLGSERRRNNKNSIPTIKVRKSQTLMCLTCLRL